jgi:hypothetical protein
LPSLVGFLQSVGSKERACSSFDNNIKFMLQLRTGHASWVPYLSFSSGTTCISSHRMQTDLR